MQQVQKENYKIIPIGSWETITEGKDAVLITYGSLLDKAKKIIDGLNELEF